MTAVTLTTTIRTSSKPDKVKISIGSTQVSYETYTSKNATTKSVSLLSYTNSQVADAGYINGALGLYLENSAGAYYFQYHYLDSIKIVWNYILPTYTINASADIDAGGSVSGDIGTFDVTTGSQTKTVTATAKSGYIFNHWIDSSGNVVSTNPSYSISFSHTSINAHATTLNLTAVFVPSSFTIAVQASPSVGGIVTGGGIYNQGDIADLSATPNAGYKFLYWENGDTNVSRLVTVTSDATYTAYFSKSVYVTYDSIFSFTKWKNEGIVGSNATVSNITDTGFTLTCSSTAGEGTASSPFFPVNPGESYTIDIDISDGTWDVYIFFCDKDGTWIDFADGPTNRFSNSTNWGNTFTAPNKEEVVKAQIRVDANGSGNTISFDNFRIFPADYSYMSTSIASIDRDDVDFWSMPTPTRQGFTFLGWNENADGEGETYTSNSAFPTKDLVLYSQWKKNTVQISASIIGEGTISPNSIEIEAGQSLTFTVTPNDYYGIYSITVNGSSITPATTFTLTNIVVDTIIEVVFKKIVPKIVYVEIEKDNTLDGIIVQQSANIIVKVIEQFED